MDEEMEHLHAYVNSSISEKNIMTIPLDILEHMFINLSSIQLSTTCRLVCKAWRDILDSYSFWIHKCKHDGTAFPDWSDYGFDLDLKRIAVKRPFNRNFLKNWNAEDLLKGWLVSSSGGNGWKTEENACAGAMEISTVGIPGLKKCWVTSYGWGIKTQVIDLISEGIQAEVLDQLKPPILISDFTAPRFDCGSLYEMKVKLLDARGRQLLEVQKRRTENQWTGGEWKQVMFMITDYPIGVRKIDFQHGGRDSQFWAGHYGPKFTGSVVRVLASKSQQLPEDVDTKGRVCLIE